MLTMACAQVSWVVQKPGRSHTPTTCSSLVSMFSTVLQLQLRGTPLVLKQPLPVGLMYHLAQRLNHKMQSLFILLG